MASVIKIIGSRKLKQQLKKKITKAQKSNTKDVIVGYSAGYALYVHEMPMVNQGSPRTGKRADGSKRKGFWWEPLGKAKNKFLEDPARENRNEISAIIINTYKQTGNMLTALLQAGLFLQRISQKMVPVDTGNLKQSAFTEPVSKI